MNIPLLPGATGFTHLKVYDSPSIDGLRGGSPHLHFACTEAYFVLSGRGAVQSLDASGFRQTPLEAGQLTWFSPGVIHRLVNLDGALEILVVMQNSGLPEAGDFVLTFPSLVLSNREEYAKHAALDVSGAVYASGEDAARARRDLAVGGFLELRERFERDGERALRDFYEQGLNIVRPLLPTWRQTWHDGPKRAASETQTQLDTLESGDISAMLAGQLRSIAPEPKRRLGMCGALGIFLPEGKSI